MFSTFCKFYRSSHGNESEIDNNNGSENDSEYVRICKQIQIMREEKSNRIEQGSFEPNPTTDACLANYMAMDLMGPLTLSGPDNHIYILVMNEYLTRYIKVASLPYQTAESVAQAFIKNIITRLVYQRKF